MSPFIGTAAWSIPAPHRPAFPSEGSILERYATRLNAVEINSSFYRPHRPATYRRWAETVPEDFRFAVKVPKAITHERRLADCAAALDDFLAQAGELGPKLGVLLVQLPPNLSFSPQTVEAFFTALRARHEGAVVCEPRHRSWFTPPAETLLVAHRIARVAADPAVVPAAGEPGGWPGLVYHRLHGAPKLYYSDYDAAALDRLAATMAQATVPAWCIFDNTALGHATANALALTDRLVP